jgi:hypothetical protein
MSQSNDLDPTEQSDAARLAHARETVREADADMAAGRTADMTAAEFSAWLRAAIDEGDNAPDADDHSLQGILAEARLPQPLS